MLACIPSATLHGVDGKSVSVELHVSNGLPAFTVVGLPDAAVRESRDRVQSRAALERSPLAPATGNGQPCPFGHQEERGGARPSDRDRALGSERRAGTPDGRAPPSWASSGWTGHSGRSPE